MTDSKYPASSATEMLLRLAQTPVEPPMHLWPRIQTAQALRVRRRRVRRWAAGCGALVLIVAATLGGLQHALSTRLRESGDIDWQARAQALELQWHALASDQSGSPAKAVAWDAEPAAFELANLDRRLQSAYESDLRRNDLAALWKRRSELLDTLIAARKHGLILTRI